MAVEPTPYSKDKVASTSVDRWILREGWYFLGWTVNRQMVQLHDKIGIGIMAAAPVIGLLAALMTEPIAAVSGISLFAAGAVHWGVCHRVKKDAEARPVAPPKLSELAHKFLSKAVVQVAGRELLGQHYYGKKLKQSVESPKGTAAEVVNEIALAAWEILAAEMNRVGGATKELGEPAWPMLRAAQEAYAASLEDVAMLDRYPERADALRPRIERTARQLRELADAIEPMESASSDELRTRLEAWIEVMEQETPDRLPDIKA